MAHIIIDRRKNDKGKSTDNRRRFVKRVKDQVKDAVKDVIRNGSIKDILSNKGKKIRIPGKGLNQPDFQHDPNGGIKDRVHPGNKQFSTGDRVKRPQNGEGQGGGKKAGNDGEGEDAFTFSLTRDEFLDIFFEDLELPDLVKQEITKLEEFAYRRAGFSVDGPPSRLNIVRSMKQAKGRRFALRNPKKKQIKQLLKELELLTAITEADLTDEQKKRIEEIEHRITALKRKLKAVPFIDDVDLRFNRWERVPIPTTQAVMFGIMDCSGSMGEWEKEMAKRFFMLLLLFLTYNYERVDIVWIRHHTIATEVEEEDFFHARDTGGTLVSPALELMKKIIDERYNPNQWNIFGCQISDGDNWPEDTPKSIDILSNQLLPISRYFAYVEIDQHGGKDSDLWPEYDELKQTKHNMEMTVITSPTDIYPVFRSLFEKRKA